MATITWINGTKDSAPSWQAMMDLVRARQWSEMGEYGFRVTMAHRAILWSGIKIDMGAEPREFFAELLRARILSNMEGN